ncbi:hypothetical protein [Microtetraspora sp. NBRC 13810]|nr:hypothetical protein [Microtetraspora sp. NBRC 13810]
MGEPVLIAPGGNAMAAPDGRASASPAAGAGRCGRRRASSSTAGRGR